jgi:hypothetical protein
VEEALLLLIFRGIALLFKGIFLLLKKIFELIRDAILFLWRMQSGEMKRDASRLTISRDGPAKAPSAKETAQTKASKSRAALAKALDDLARAVATEARRCVGEEGNGALGAALSQIGDRVRAIQGDLRRGGDAAAPQVAREAAGLDAVARAIGVMTAQRRDPDLMLLLGDADALAEACYRPIVEYARGASIPLTFERAATVLGDSDLFAALFENPARLAPIVLPADWPVQVAWWPALVHEVGHCFYRSVLSVGAGGQRRSLDGELRARLKLPRSGGLPTGQSPLTEADVASALGAWLEEIFADAFGVMMLGPAFVRTMIWAFAGKPDAVVTCDPILPENRFEEHPPAHLRVVLGCRLLARMGYATEARHLEAEWRARHGQPQQFWVPTRGGRWIGLAEEPLLIRAEVLVTSFYEDGFTMLAGEPLRSIPGLDFGPREHQAALEVASALLARRAPETRDPRILISGAVQAWARDPKQGALVLRGARAHIPAVEVSRRRLRLRAEAADAEDLASLDGDAGDAILAEAVLLDAILNRPSAGRRRLAGRR